MQQLDLLTIRQLQILRKMRDEDEELVYSKGRGYVGDEQIGPKTLFALLRVMAIKLDQFSRVGDCEYYTINETGEALLEKSDAAA
jgi:hypothetical protein